MENGKVKCEGECSRENKCIGDVRRVHVRNNRLTRPFEFNYCEIAIEEDERSGFHVEVIEEPRK
jgi:hypothetical protein